MSEDEEIEIIDEDAGVAGKIAKIRKELEVCRSEKAEYLAGWQRAKADYINFKNDQEKRSKELAQFASISLVMQLLPIAEHFRKAFACLTDDLKLSEWVRGIEQIYRQFKDALKGMGIEEMAGVVGTAFDPAHHLAVGNEQRDDLDDGIVSQEIETGYLLHGRVIVPTKVIVNKKTPK